MAYSAPTTRSTGFLVTAAVWNQDVVDNVTFLANPPACRAYHNTTQAVANLTTVVLALNSERYDTTGSMHDLVTNNSRITIGTAGLYMVTGHFELTARADYTHVWGGIRLNGTTFIAEQNSGTVADVSLTPACTIATVYKFAAADYVELIVIQENAAAASPNALATGNSSPEFTATWVGLG